MRFYQTFDWFYQLLIKVERLQNFNADTEIQVNGEWAGN